MWIYSIIRYRRASLALKVESGSSPKSFDDGGAGEDGRAAASAAALVRSEVAARAGAAASDRRSGMLAAGPHVGPMYRHS